MHETHGNEQFEAACHAAGVAGSERHAAEASAAGFDVLALLRMLAAVAGSPAAAGLMALIQQWLDGQKRSPAAA